MTKWFDNQNEATQRGEGSGREYKSQSSQHTAKVLTAKAQHANWPIGTPPPPPSYCCSLVQTNWVAHCLTMTAAVWKPCSTMFCTILDTEGNQMGIKYSIEGFIKYLIINTVGNSKRGLTDLDASERSLEKSRMTTCRINPVPQSTVKLMYI